MPGKSSKHIPQVVVKNGDESHGIESPKKSPTKPTKKGTKNNRQVIQSALFGMVKWPFSEG